MNQKNTYFEYLRERKRNRRITIARKLIGYSFLAIFLYFLFTVSYTASPAIVILNYLALLTSFSGLVFYKMFEIPSCVQDILYEKDSAGIFHITDAHRFQILDTTAKDMNLDTKGVDLVGCKAPEIIDIFQLEKRLPWRRLGIIYLIIYLVTVVSFCTYLIFDYWETGFLRP